MRLFLNEHLRRNSAILALMEENDLDEDLKAITPSTALLGAAAKEHMTNVKRAIADGDAGRYVESFRMEHICRSAFNYARKKDATYWREPHPESPIIDGQEQ